MAVIYLHSDDVSDKARNTHRFLGYAVMLAGVLQPVNAVFRGKAPKNPEEPKVLRRITWELAHKGLGYSAAVAAFVVMWIGINLGYSPIETRKNTCAPLATR